MLTKLRKKIKENEYVRYIEEHRINIYKAFEEMLLCPDMDWMNWNEELCCKLFNRVINHDISKYSVEEFNPYREYYHPINAEEKANAAERFEQAWKHHWENNDHHWQCRRRDMDGPRMTEEQQLACLENILDWMAMGYKFNNRPYEYYESIKNKINLPQVQIKFMEKIIYEGIDKQHIKEKNNGNV